jgi:hypothetical protein
MILVDQDEYKDILHILDNGEDWFSFPIKALEQVIQDELKVYSHKVDNYVVLKTDLSSVYVLIPTEGYAGVVLEFQ